MRTIKFVLIFLLAIGWLYTSWPHIGNFPPRAEEAKAAHTFDTNLRFTGASSPLTSSYTAGNGATVLVLGIVTAGTTLRTGGAPMFNGLDLTQADSTRGGGTGYETSVELWYFVDPPTGSAYSISVPNTGTATLYVQASTYKAQSGYTSALDTANGTAATSGSNPSVSVTTNANGDTIVGVLGDGYRNAPSADSGTTLNINDNGSYSDSNQYYLQATAGIYAMNWTVSSDDRAAVVAAFKEATIPAITTLGDGTNPSNKTLTPGAVATSSDIFTFRTDSGTESITNVTTTLAGTGQYAGISKLEIVDEASTTVYGSVTNPSTDAFSISLSGLTASTATSTLQIRITPFSATGMPGVPGALYTVTSTITAWTGADGNTQAGTDSGSATITIDNLSPSDVTNATSTPGDTQVIVDWTNPGGDFSNVIVVRATSTPNSGTPTEGSSPFIGTNIGNGAVIYNSNGITVTDTSVVNGTIYYYKIWAKDAFGNYSQNGVETSSTPNVTTMVSCSTNISSKSFGILSTSSISTASPNSSTTMTCTYPNGCTLNIQDFGNDSSPGLAAFSPDYLIFSETTTLSAGTEGYGIQATTTGTGNGGILSLNPVYNKSGNDVGGLTLGGMVLASSTLAVTNREVVVTHKATISKLTYAGDYSDTITYSCSGN